MRLWKRENRKVKDNDNEITEERIRRNRIMKMSQLEEKE